MLQMHNSWMQLTRDRFMAPRRSLNGRVTLIDAIGASYQRGPTVWVNPAVYDVSMSRHQSRRNEPQEMMTGGIRVGRIPRDFQPL
jgi:hypothetical protein